VRRGNRSPPGPAGPSEPGPSFSPAWSRASGARRRSGAGLGGAIPATSASGNRQSSLPLDPLKALLDPVLRLEHQGELRQRGVQRGIRPQVVVLPRAVPLPLPEHHQPLRYLRRPVVGPGRSRRASPGPVRAASGRLPKDKPSVGACISYRNQLRSDTRMALRSRANKEKLINLEFLGSYPACPVSTKNLN